MNDEKMMCSKYPIATKSALPAGIIPTNLGKRKEHLS
jgi:hypothetical protein